jgi:hypothetical protein
MDRSTEQPSQKKAYAEPSLDRHETLAEVAEGPGATLSTGGGGVPIMVP